MHILRDAVMQRETEPINPARRKKAQKAGLKLKKVAGNYPTKTCTSLLKFLYFLSFFFKVA